MVKRAFADWFPFLSPHAGFGDKKKPLLFSFLFRSHRLLLFFAIDIIDSNPPKHPKKISLHTMAVTQDDDGRPLCPNCGRLLSQDRDDNTPAANDGDDTHREDGNKDKDNNNNDDENPPNEEAKDSNHFLRNGLYGVAAVGAVVATGGLALTLAGFGTAGIVGGSVAAGVQSSIGNVAAGSLFAALQSAGATGTITAATSCGAATATGGVATATLLGRKKQKDHEKNDQKDEQAKQKKIDPPQPVCPVCGQAYTEVAQ